MAGARRPKVTKALGEAFADQLRRHRKRAELTQEQLAQKAGVAAGTVSSAELGRAIPRAETVRKLATALGLRGIAHKRFMDAANTTVVAAAKRSSVQRTPGVVGSGGRVRRVLQVFLCHSSGDKATVRALYQRLKREPGINTWLDEESLLPGQDWDAEIRKAVRASDIVVVCLSQGSISKTGYVQKEIGFALDVAEEQPEDKIFLIPLRLEECIVPQRLRRWHWVDYFDATGYQRLMRALGTRVYTPRSRPSQGKTTSKARAERRRVKAIL